MREYDQMSTFFAQLINGNNEIKMIYAGKTLSNQDLSQEDQNFLFRYFVEMEKLMTKIDF